MSQVTNGWIMRMGLAVMAADLGVASPCLAAFDFEQASDAFGYHEAFGIDPERTEYPYRVTLIGSNAAGNAFHPGERPEFRFQIENLTDQPITADGNADVIQYGGRSRPGEQWVPEFFRIDEVGSAPIGIDLEAKGWQNLTIQPPTPEPKGGYAVVIDLGEHGRQLLTNYVRTFRVATKRVQFPKQSLESMPPEILNRLGVQAIRYGVAYRPSHQVA